MEQLLKKHPCENLSELIGVNNINTIKYLNNNNEIDEMWEVDDKGHWRDVTQREKLKQELIKAQQELLKLQDKENGDGK